MQTFSRPNEPQDFSAKVQIARTNLNNFFARDENDRINEKPPFPDLWGDFKQIFMEAQFGKCCYCERMVQGTHPCDVEHFYPKGAVFRLGDTPDTWGQERLWLSTVKGRRKNLVCSQGYWWLAYEWTNYLLSCTACNSYWKISFFPVQENPRTLPPNRMTVEVPLLLNPFDLNKNPADHLRFDDLGQISAKAHSIFGIETIKLCGLDRESVRKSRLEKARRAHFLVQKLNQDLGQNEIDNILEQIYELGDIEYPHSGMVRSIFEEYSGMRWEDLEDYMSP